MCPSLAPTLYPAGRLRNFLTRWTTWPRRYGIECQDVSKNPRDWESARTPGTAPQWNLPAEQEEPEVPASYHYDLDAMVTETPVESTKTYTGIPVSNRAPRVLQHVAFGKEADKSSTLSGCVHLPKSDFKTCARYSLALSAQEEQILGQKQPIKAGKLESQEKVVTALRDEMPFDKDFFADSRVVLQHQTDAMKAGLAVEASISPQRFSVISKTGSPTWSPRVR